MYSMVTLDTIFVRTSCRRRGLASEAVEDLVKDVPAPNNIGFSYPISTGMLKGIISITVPTLVTHVGVGLRRFDASCRPYMSIQDTAGGF